MKACLVKMWTKVQPAIVQSIHVRVKRNHCTTHPDQRKLEHKDKCYYCICPELVYSTAREEEGMQLLVRSKLLTNCPELGRKLVRSKLGIRWSPPSCSSPAPPASLLGLDKQTTTERNYGPMAASNDHLFPKIFGELNKKGAPAKGLIIGSLLTSVIMLMNLSEGLVDQFTLIAEIVVFSALIPYLFVAASYILVLIERKIHINSWVKTLALGMLGIAYSLWALYGIGEQSVFYGFLLLLTGIPFYALMQWNKREK